MAAAYKGSKLAARAVGISLALILVTNVYELVAGTSPALVSQRALIATCIIAVIATLQLVYSNAMQTRGVLR